MEKRKLIKMKTEIKIENLKCDGCSNTIKKGLLDLESINEVDVNIENAIVSITSEKNMQELVEEKLSKLGYPVVGKKNTVIHKAKSFVSCAVGRVGS